MSVLKYKDPETGEVKSVGSPSLNTYSASEIDVKLTAKAPTYTYGTTDLTEGVSLLPTGKLHFVYE